MSAMAAGIPFDEDPESHTYVLLCEPGFEDVLPDAFVKVAAKMK